MMTPLIVVSLLALGLAGTLVWSFLGQRKLGEAAARAKERAEHAEREAEELRAVRDQLVEVERDSAAISARLEEMQRRHEEKVRDLESHNRDQSERDEQRVKAINEQYQEKLEALTAKALKESGDQFLKLAGERFAKHEQAAKEELGKRHKAIDELVKPVAETLGKTREGLIGLHEQVRAMREGNATLSEEARRLTQALSKPQVRGAYGEIQLRRVVELAGMTNYCDFDEQTSVRTDEGDVLRPDLVVKLPNGRTIVVDAKANIEPYMQAVESRDESEQTEQMDRFARGVLDQAKKLSKKEYAANVDEAFDFVVMFIPGDQFIDAALEREPKLLELAGEHGVLLASPSTLIGLLRAVAVGWREKDLSDQAEELFELGRELHARMGKAFEHMNAVGRSISQAASNYNKLVGSVDARVMPQLQRFEDAGAKSSQALPEVKMVDGEVRESAKLFGDGRDD
ncbi:MAG: DNA recombination protein RmuC [Planctomycetota bacterium]